MVPPRPFFAHRPSVIYITDNVCLAAWNGSDTSSGLWTGMQGICEPQGCDLLAVIGDKRLSGFISVSHDLLTPQSADGFLAWRARSGADCESYFRQFSASPLIFLSTVHAPKPVVAVPNRQGMLDLVNHLIEVHGCRKIAYLGGPASHRYAQERLAAYKEALNAHGIDIHPQWLTPPGPWATATGQAGAAVLFGERGLRPGIDIDAIVCASDQLALGAMEEMALRGIDVPGQVAITGFNNIREARTHFPSLCTAAMPFHQQGRQALLQVLTQIGLLTGTPDDPELKPLMIIGETCGCGNQRLMQWHTGKSLPAPQAPHPDLQPLLEQHLQQLLRHDEVAGCACTLIDTLRKATQDGHLQPALQQILPLIRTGYFGLLDQVFWQQAFGVARQTLPQWCPDPAARADGEISLESLRETVAEYYSREQGALTVWENKVFDLLRLLSADLALVDSIPAMMNRLSADFAPLSIHSCWLALYDHLPQEGKAPEKAHLWLALEQGRRYELPPQGKPFASRDFIPEGYRQNQEAGVYVLSPIMHGEFEYGYVIFNQSSSTNYYETLANAIGSAMRHLQLRNELARQTTELARSYQELVGAQKRLVEADKMAALGELVAGIAHEINTPVGVGVTAVSTILDETRALADLVERRQAKPIPGIVQNLQESALIAMRNLERAAQLIESFKLIAVDQTRAEVRTFNLHRYLDDVVRSVSPRLRSGSHQVTIDCPETIELTCDPSIIARILTNLMINSLLHGFENRREGLISVQCRAEGPRIVIEYRDNGCGMDAATLEKMFHPFFTTKRGRGGTGLGMHIVYNLVVKGLGGQIEASSTPGSGAHFRMNFPAQTPA